MICLEYTKESRENPSLTCLDSRQSSQEGNGIHDALLSVKAAGSQDPCRTGMDDKDVKEETCQT